jgi:murein DD-endopeptidase MepM/ murein hydrolase activator NlpD
MRALSTCIAALALLSSCSTFRGPQYASSGGRTPQAAADEGNPNSIQWAPGKGYSRPNEPFQFDWPLDRAKMSRGFLPDQKRPHWGLDLAGPRGTPILAAERGVVIYTGRGFRGYGNLIVVEHNDEWATLYAHLDKILVKEGDKVFQGQKIGNMGRTGRATGVHLHFEVRQHRLPVNPLALLPQGFSPR